MSPRRTGLKLRIDAHAPTSTDAAASWQQFVARFEAEKTKQQQRYCERFALWRECPVRRCRRDRTCRGHLNYCMLHAIHTMPRRDLSQALDDIMKATPANIGAPERAARRCSPHDLCMANTTADAVAHYLWQQNYRLNFDRPHRDKLRALQHSAAAELNTRYILNIRFDFGSVTLDAELLHTSAATVIKTLLPINATVVTWDGGLYFQIGTKATLLSGARTEVALGEIAYCPDTGAIAIAFGREPMPADPETQRERPCNVWARALGDVRTLAAVKDGTQVKISGWLAPLKGGINGAARRHGRR